jgi:hypothetical protein
MFSAITPEYWLLCHGQSTRDAKFCARQSHWAINVVDGTTLIGQNMLTQSFSGEFVIAKRTSELRCAGRNSRFLIVIHHPLIARSTAHGAGKEVKRS